MTRMVNSKRMEVEHLVLPYKIKKNNGIRKIQIGKAHQTAKNTVLMAFWHFCAYVEKSF